MRTHGTCMRLARAFARHMQAPGTCIHTLHIRVPRSCSCSRARLSRETDGRSRRTAKNMARTCAGSAQAHGIRKQTCGMRMARVAWHAHTLCTCMHVACACGWHVCAHGTRMRMARACEWHIHAHCASVPLACACARRSRAQDMRMRIPSVHGTCMRRLASYTETCI